MTDRGTWLRRPRVVDFYESLVACVPCLPDTPSTRLKLVSMPLTDVMICYVNYADRFIAPRPRVVSWAPSFWDAPDAQAQISSVFEIVREIEQGTDLQRRLSHRTLKAGFAPDAANKWEDKDFVLNAYDVHHLHLGRIDKRGMFKHADPLLFLTVSRTNAHFLMLGTHKSFGDRSLEQIVAAERSRAGYTMKGVRPSRSPLTLDKTHRLARIGYATSIDVKDEVVPLAMLMSSGHRLRSVRFADEVLRLVEHLDPVIDEPDFVAKAFGVNAGRIASKPHFVWRMQFLDLMLLDKKSMTAGSFLMGSH